MNNIEQKIDEIVNKVLSEELGKKINTVKTKLNENNSEELDEMDKFYKIAQERRKEREMKKMGDKDYLENMPDYDEIGVYSNIKNQSNEMSEEEEELSEDSFNYVAALAKVDGKDKFDFGGETHDVTMNMDTAKRIVGDVKKDSVEDDEVQIKALEKDKKDDENKEKEVKKESKKQTLQLTEAEMIELIERIVIQEKSAVESMEKKNSKESKKSNDDYIKDVTKKMKDYMSNMGIEYKADSDEFPRGNTMMDITDKDGKTKMSDKKQMYNASDSVEEYIDQVARSGGMENLDYDQIKPNEDWVELNIMGSEKTGNSPEYANAVKTDVNKDVNKRRKLNVLAKLKKMSYQKADQPVYDVAGSEKHSDEMNYLTASVEEKKQTKINEDLDKMKNLIDYNRKTQ